MNACNTSFAPRKSAATARVAPALLALALLASSGLQADFTDAELTLHPYVPQYRPFVLDLRGTWANTCHPGIAEPVITAVDGPRVEIDLVLDELLLCLPDVESPYRVLVDLSDAFDVNDIVPLPAADLFLEVVVRFLDETFTGSALLGCFGPNACPGSFFTHLQHWPEPGLYQTQGLAKQGLLLARQDDRLAAYPLTYDGEGGSEWLFAGGGVTGDVYFAPLYQASGGQCLGCPPPDDPLLLEPAGKISMVFDSEGVAQVKIDDGPFVEYRQLDFGYGNLPREFVVPDLSGRWALVETELEMQNNLSIPPGAVLPLVFDLSIISAVPPPVGSDPPEPVVFALAGADGEVITAMECEATPEVGCLVANPDFDDGSHAFTVEFLSPERILLTDTGPMLAIGVPATGIAVRID